MRSDENLFAILIYIAAFVITFVIVVGGIVCLIDSEYTFAAYLNDLQAVWPYLAGAVVAVLLRSLVRKRNGPAERPPT